MSLSFTLPQSLHSAAWGERAGRVLSAALQAADPAAAVARSLQRDGDTLLIGGQKLDLSRYGRVFVLGAGKAGAPMAGQAARILGDRITAGLVIVKDGYTQVPENQTGHESSSRLLRDLPGFDRLEILEAGHPIPDERGVKGARRMIALLEGTRANDLVLCLMSGGGSALLVSPAGDLTLEDLQGASSALLASGASIHEFNTLRKHLERLKGGNLARLAAPADLVTLILSDVVGSPLEIIASGPTVPDPSTYADALRVLEKYRIQDRVPPAVIAHLGRGLRGELPETPKPGDPVFLKVLNLIIGSNLQAAEAALEQAGREGFHTLLLTTFLEGEASQMGRALAAIARQIALDGRPIPRPACLVAGGETTVTIQGDGLGGRNQEVALGAVGDLAGLENIALVTLATDGGDGPTDAAGAVVTGETLRRARRLGMAPEDHLARNDAYRFFEALGDLLITGPTLTNVNDLSFIFAF